MVTLNHILLFLALVSPLAVLARTWRPNPMHRGWRVAAAIVLIVTILAWLFFRSMAGYIGAAVWFFILLLPGLGMRQVVELSTQHKFSSARKLAVALRWLHPTRDLAQEIEVLRRLESRQAAGLIPENFPAPTNGGPPVLWRLRQAPAVCVFILLNAAAFIPEQFATLHQLGALEPYAVIARHEYWRLLTAFFLHAGIVHLLFNLFALYVLGPPLERAIGSMRFCVCYLLSGIGSTLGVLLLSVARVIDTGQLVGASGCIMGIVGGWGAFLLRHRHMPMARQRLWNVIMIVIIQIVFDASTPEVSSSAHLCGLATGFVVGLLIAPTPIDRRS